MKNFLIRWLIRLRWVLGGLVILAVAAFFASGWFAGGYQCSDSNSQAFLQFANGSMNIITAREATFGNGLIFYALDPEWDDVGSWNYWISSEFAGTWEMVTIPLWPIVIALAAAAFMGFLLRHAQPDIAFCESCRHVLAGASVCPECGNPAR